jgi:Spy/CpxP family protein refolding chaperone
MKVKDVVAGTVLAVGLGVGSLAGAGVASAAPGAPSIDIAQKPHHGDWGHGKRGHGGWYPGIDACISATGPYGNVSGFVCI